MYHLPRLHPDDLKEIKEDISKSVGEAALMALATEIASNLDHTYTPDELAEKLQKDNSTIIKYFQKGLFPGGFKCGNEWRLTRENYRKFVKNTGNVS